MSRSLGILISFPVLAIIAFYVSLGWSIFGNLNVWLAWLLPLLLAMVFVSLLGLFFTVSRIEKAHWSVIAVAVLGMSLFFGVTGITINAVISLSAVMLVATPVYAFVYSRIREETTDRISYRPIKIVPSFFRLMVGVNALLVAVLVFNALQQNISFDSRAVELPESWAKVPVRIVSPVLSGFVSNFSTETTIEELFEGQLQTQTISDRNQQQLERLTGSESQQLQAQKQQAINDRIEQLENALNISIEPSDTIPEILQTYANTRLQRMFGNNSGMAAGAASALLFFALWTLSILLMPVLILFLRTEQALFFALGVLESQEETVKKQVVEPNE